MVLKINSVARRLETHFQIGKTIYQIRKFHFRTLSLLIDPTAVDFAVDFGKLTGGLGDQLFS